MICNSANSVGIATLTLYLAHVPTTHGTATHSSMLAWKIPTTEEPGGLHAVPCIQSKLCDMTEWLILSCTRCLARVPTTCEALTITISTLKVGTGLPRWSRGQEFACQCRGVGFNLFSVKSPQAAGQLVGAPQLSLCPLQPACHWRSPPTATTILPTTTKTQGSQISKWIFLKIHKYKTYLTKIANKHLCSAL